MMSTQDSGMAARISRQSPWIDFDVMLGVVEDGSGESFLPSPGLPPSPRLRRDGGPPSPRLPPFAKASARRGGAFRSLGLRRGEIRDGFGHGFGAIDDQVGSLIEW